SSVPLRILTPVLVAVLVLQPGGLVKSGYGKIIMTVVFSLSVFCLAFHRVTRNYGLIFSIAFSGATITVLGIDFFSRAGLKEFWLYVWGTCQEPQDEAVLELILHICRLEREHIPAVHRHFPSDSWYPC